MLTYEDWIECGNDENKKIDFILRAIGEHKRSKAYLKAVEAQKYYDGENPTIMNYEKILYDMAGKAHIDMWSANHKIASQFFSMAVNQEVAYLLGNGVRFGKDQTKEKLGKKFDLRVMRAALYARIGGQSFGFWNMDHVDVFRFQEFVPIRGAEDGLLKLGIRWWQIDTTKPMRVTLYEIDGKTEYIQRQSDKMEVYAKKEPYKMNVSRTDAEGDISAEGENYDGFPIVPMYGNEQHQSSLTGKRNTIDALDLANSNMVNNVDEGNLIYWVLTNCGGMDDLDDAKFIEQLKTTHVTHADGDAGAKAEAHSIEAPFQGTSVTIEKLESRLYKDFQAFNPDSVSQSNQSATAIKASYIPLDLKCDIVIEPQVTEFILNILKLAGIDDEPSYQRNQIVNKQEETQTIVMQAEYFDDEYITKKLLSINGDIDMYDELMKRKDAEDAERLKQAEKRLKELEAEKAANAAQGGVQIPEEGAAE